MRLNASYARVETEFGWVVVVRSEMGLRSVSLPQSTSAKALAMVNDLVGGAREDAAGFGDLLLRLQRYFRGEVIEFPDALDYGKATGFQVDVWEATRGISYGQVGRYAEVAERIGRPRAYRAVGGALGRNPISIVVPCHRVVGAEGLCGFGGGLDLKRRLLDLEANGVGKASS
jgi:epoxyqueuosine reductase